LGAIERGAASGMRNARLRHVFDKTLHESENGGIADWRSRGDVVETKDAVRGYKIKLFKFLGIAFQIDLVWIFVFAMLTFSLASQFSKDHPHWSWLHYSAAGLLTCLLFFFSIVLHELAHSLVAKAAGLPVRSITLFILGGVSQIGREAQRPGIEFLVAAAGPIASIATSAVFGIVWLLSRPHLETVAVLSEWLAEINFMLALFNLIPGFPLDGGRMVRAALWGFSGDFSRATRVASTVGRAVASMLFFGGIILMFDTQFAYGFWTLFIGWFLWVASRQNERQAELRDSLAGVTAADLMATDCPRVEKGTSLALLHERDLGDSPRPYLLVLDDGVLVGALEWELVSRIPKGLWETTWVEDVMTPVSKLRMVHPTQDIVRVLEAMDREGLGHVPVFGDGQLLGILGRSRVYHFLQTRLHASA
jgi:Zn-dependent protease/CBS domain-containing protein